LIVNNILIVIRIAEIHAALPASRHVGHKVFIANYGRKSTLFRAWDCDGEVIKHWAYNKERHNIWEDSVGIWKQVQ